MTTTAAPDQAERQPVIPPIPLSMRLRTARTYARLEQREMAAAIGVALSGADTTRRPHDHMPTPKQGLEPDVTGLSDEQITLALRAHALAAAIVATQARTAALAAQRARVIAGMRASGLTIRRIAQALGTSTGPVEAALARARRRTDPSSSTDRNPASEGDRP